MNSNIVVIIMSVLLVSSDMQMATAFNILALTATESRSHFTFLTTITSALLERGHHVYEFVPMPTPKHPNRTTFSIGDTIDTIQLNFTSLSQRTDFTTAYRQGQFTIRNCQKALKSDAAKQFLALARDPNRRPRIDVVLLDYLFGICAGAFAKEFGNPPIIAVTAYGNPVEIDEVVGGPMFPTYVPHDLLFYSRHAPMTWGQRLHNKFVYLINQAVHWLWQYPKVDEEVKKLFGENAATVGEITDRVDVALVNGHPAIQGARPQLPAVIQVGGLHVRPPRDIPPGELREFVDSAKDGFIFMSFGSLLKAASIGSSKRKELMKAFKRLQPMRVLLKWEEPWDKVADGPMPPNVMINPWFPQSDILAHPNIRVFVTHCGGLSTNEIIARAVPVVAIPMFVDQHLNAHSLVTLNVAKLLLYKDLNEDTLYNAVQEVLHDERYLKAVRRLSAITSDEPETPLKRAVFWVEYVARHGGAPHLRSPARHLPWVARWMIDDALIFIVLLFALLTAVRFLRKLRIQVRSATEKIKGE